MKQNGFKQDVKVEHNFGRNLIGEHTNARCFTVLLLAKLTLRRYTESSNTIQQNSFNMVKKKDTLRIEINLVFVIILAYIVIGAHYDQWLWFKMVKYAVLTLWRPETTFQIWSKVWTL